LVRVGSDEMHLVPSACGPSVLVPGVGRGGVAPHVLPHQVASLVLVLCKKVLMLSFSFSVQRCQLHSEMALTKHDLCSSWWSRSLCTVFSFFRCDWMITQQNFLRAGTGVLFRAPV
jgi:hypothetical protein